MPESRQRLAYLLCRFPSFSHTFILREVQALRALGWTIDTTSVNSPDLAVMPPDEAAAAASTYYVKRHGVRGALQAHASALIKHPAGWLRGLRMAFRLGGSDPRRMLRGIAYFTEALMVGRWMAEREHYHLHVHFATAAANVGMYVKEVFACSLSLTIHGPDEFSKVDTEWLPEKIAAADFLLCISNFARSQLMRLVPADQWHKFQVARLGVDTTHFVPAEPVVPPRAAPFRLLCVGRLTPAKGQHVLVQAMQKLKAQGYPIALTLVGAGPDMDSLVRAVAAHGLTDSVHFTGPLDQGAVHALYRQSDVFVLPSFAEGVPVVLMEAMAMGVPCVSTAINGIPELIDSGADGLLVLPSDVDALVQAIIRLIEDPLLRLTLAREGRARVVSQYDLRKNIQRMAGVMRQQLEQLAA